MAGEIWLALAAACVAATTAIAVVREVRRRTYEPRHTAELQAVPEHVGATEEWSPRATIAAAPPPPPVDPRILLAEAEGELIRAQRRVVELRALVRRQDDDRLHIALDALQGRLVDKLRRAGHADIHTAEIPRYDIRRPVRSGA